MTSDPRSQTGIGLGAESWGRWGRAVRWTGEEEKGGGQVRRPREVDRWGGQGRWTGEEDSGGGQVRRTEEVDRWSGQVRWTGELSAGTAELHVLAASASWLFFGAWVETAPVWTCPYLSTLHVDQKSINDPSALLWIQGLRQMHLFSWLEALGLWNSFLLGIHLSNHGNRLYSCQKLWDNL